MRRTLVLLALVACGKKEAPAPAPSTTPVPAAPVASTSATTAVVDAAPLKTSLQYTAAFVHFEKGRLFECVDVDLTVHAPADAGADWKPPKDPLAEMAKKFKGTSRIDQPCSAQFADRTVLASCTYALDEKPVDGGPAAGAFASGTFRTSFYDFADVGLDDNQMADCMKAKGKWTAVARDSVEWRKARLEHNRKNLQKQVDKLSDDPE